MSVAKHRAPVLQTCGLGRASSDTSKNFKFEVQTGSWKAVIGASCPPAAQSYRCHVILTEPRGSANQIRRRPTKSTIRPPRNSRMRSWRLSLGLKFPPRSSMMTCQPPSHRQRPGPRHCPTMLRLKRSVFGANGAGERSSAGGRTRRLIRPWRQLPQQLLHPASQRPPPAKWTSRGVGGTRHR